MRVLSNQLRFYLLGDIEIIDGVSSHSFPKHSHQQFCLGILKKGQLQFTCQKEDHLLEKHQVYWTQPFKEHTITAVQQQPYEYLTLCFGGQFTKTLSNIDSATSVCTDKTLGSQLLSACIQAIQQKNPKLLQIELEKFIKKIQLKSINAPTQPHRLALQAAEQIQKNIYAPFDLAKTADSVQMTKFHFSRWFKAEMGISPYQFCLRKKLPKIRQALIEQQPLTDLALNFGFADQSHFCHTFKKHMGITPQQYQITLTNLE